MKEENKKEKVNKEKNEEKLIKKVNILKNELELEKEKVLRTQADMFNYRKRKDEEVANLFKYANENLILTLLPIVDNFERAIKLDDNDLSDELSKFLNGFKMIYSNLIAILNQNEVVEINAQGLESDPNLHQAIVTEKDENKPAGVILEVLQKGYKYKDKVIRPAMVKVNE